MAKPLDSTQPPVAFDHESTLVAVIEMSQSSWLVAAVVPGVERWPLQKLMPDQDALLRLFGRWTSEAAHAGRTIARLLVAYEAGRDGFWLARWLGVRGVECHVIQEQIAALEAARLDRLAQAPKEGTDAMVHLLARVRGVGVETAAMLVREVLGRNLRDRRAVARYAGLTGTPDESGSRRREKGLSKAGNARVRRGMIQLAWRWLLFQKDSTLAAWCRGRTTGAKGGVRKTLIVALARKLLVDLWRLATTGQTPEGVTMQAI
ncbi:transposase [Azospirillum canadense]|uniref:transposase n=1 Tax=Azospirillum canadense TaxID=403962 RepID=UPI002225C524|nr:transposase [Azospirillum canadense]MCW2239522.1 transposase [Azospirillum canadense]